MRTANDGHVPTMTEIVKDIIAKRRLIFVLAKRDFQSQYKGSYLGLAWVFLQPLLFISVIYLVFSFGIKAGQAGDVNFAVYLVSGVVAWLFFFEVLGTGTSILEKFSFLIKRVEFKLAILPAVSIGSALPRHLFLLLLAIVVAVLNNSHPGWLLLQIAYYLLAMMLLLYGLLLATASANLFARDVAKLVAVLLQFGFWLTPVFWHIQRIPESYHWLIKLNPVCYIVEGYRDAIFRDIAFWDKPLDMLYFWLLTLVVIYIGTTVFRRLNPYFAEML